MDEKTTKAPRPLRDLASNLELQRQVARNRAVHEALSLGDAGPVFVRHDRPWSGEIPARGLFIEPLPTWVPLRVRVGWWWLEWRHRFGHAWDALRGRDCDR
jgi:hypothetical protein